MEQKRRWCQQIRKLIVDNFPTPIPDRAKQVVLGDDSGDEKNRLRTGRMLSQ